MADAVGAAAPQRPAYVLIGPPPLLRTTLAGGSWSHHLYLAIANITRSRRSRDISGAKYPWGHAPALGPMPYPKAMVRSEQGPRRYMGLEIAL